jgi:bifunctional non-homologous end joining protein LigD
MASFPKWLAPMAATLTQERFVGPEWLFERKFDGIRLLAYKNGDTVELFSRNQLPQDIPDIVKAVKDLPVKDAILDGEITWGPGKRAYHVFDVMWLDGRNVTSLPIEERRELLAQLPFKPPLQRVKLIDDPSPWELAAREGWEGVIAKRRGSIYEHRRSRSG